MERYYRDNILTMGWLSLLLVVTTSSNCLVNGFIGMDWGRMATQRIVPSMVVDMLLQSGFTEVKLFSTSDNVLDAFAGTNIGVTVTIPNDWLKLLLTVEECTSWINRNLVGNLNHGINIKYVSVGSQAYSGLYFNKTYYNALPVLKNFVGALKLANLSKKVLPTMNHMIDILDDKLKPSETDFKPQIKELMIESLRVLKDVGAPVSLDIFPIYNTLNFTNDLEFAFFYNNSTAKFMDGEYEYNNIFEVMYDKFMVALEKNGLTGLKVYGGQLGWPTDGIEGATIENAQRFHNGLVKYFLSGKGTPRHPGPIDCFLHNFVDENQLAFNDHTRYNRHWGIYRFDGQPKFSIDYTGKGRDVKPVAAKGITHMPKRWCVINLDKAHNETQVKEQTQIACRDSDCTSTFPGGSCGDLDIYAKASYAFNMYFQTRSQKISEDACLFGGLGLIIPDDPSTGKCKFPVGIIPAEKVKTSSGTYQIPFTFNILLWNILLLIMLMYL